ncbi:MAG: NTF2 fold immunity protein [Planctomycetota bacterium]|nr:NTF2 fold immunity protein [Planctomycetota bacterium]
MDDKKHADVPSDHPALRVLLEFWIAMESWEREMLVLGDRIRKGITEAEYAAARDEGKARLASIYRLHCEAGDQAERLLDKGLSWPSEIVHGLSRELVVGIETKRGKVIVESKQSTGMKYRMRYELVEKDGKWKIRDRVKYALPWGTEKWTTEFL